MANSAITSNETSIKILFQILVIIFSHYGKQECKKGANCLPNQSFPWLTIETLTTRQMTRLYAPIVFVLCHASIATGLGLLVNVLYIKLRDLKMYRYVHTNLRSLASDRYNTQIVLRNVRELMVFLRLSLLS